MKKEKKKGTVCATGNLRNNYWLLINNEKKKKKRKKGKNKGGNVRCRQLTCTVTRALSSTQLQEFFPLTVVRVHRRVCVNC